MFKKVFAFFAIMIAGFAIVGCDDGATKIDVRVLESIDIEYGDMEFFESFVSNLDEWVEIKVNGKVVESSTLEIALDVEEVDLLKSGKYDVKLIITYNEQDYTKSVEVNVTASVDVVLVTKVDTSIFVGDELDLATLFTVKINGNEIEIEEEWISSDIDLEDAGVYEVHLAFTHHETEYTKTASVTITERDAVVVTSTNAAVYVGETVDYISLFTLTIAGTSTTVTTAMVDSSSVNLNAAGTYTVTFTHVHQGVEHEKTAQVVVTARDTVVVTAKDKVLYVGDILDYTSLFTLTVAGDSIPVTTAMIDSSAVVIGTGGTYTVTFAYVHQGVTHNETATVEVLTFADLIAALAVDYSSMAASGSFEVFENPERTVSFGGAEINSRLNAGLLYVEYLGVDGVEGYLDIANMVAYYLYSHLNDWVSYSDESIDAFAMETAYYGVFISGLLAENFEPVVDSNGEYVLNTFRIKDEFVQALGEAITGRSGIVTVENIIIVIEAGKIASVVIESEEVYDFGSFGWTDYVRYEYEITQIGGVIVELPEIIDYDNIETEAVVQEDIDALTLAFAKTAALTNYTISENLSSTTVLMAGDRFLSATLYEEAYIKLVEGNYFVYTGASWADANAFYMYYFILLDYSGLNPETVRTDGEYYYIFADDHNLGDFNSFYGDFDASFYRFTINADGIIDFVQGWLSDDGASILATIEITDIDETEVVFPDEEVDPVDGEIVKEIKFEGLKDSEEVSSGITSNGVTFTGTKVFATGESSEYGCALRIGTSSLGGSVKATLDLADAVEAVAFLSRCWTTEGSSLVFKVSSGASVLLEETIVLGSTYELYVFDLGGFYSELTIEFTVSAGKNRAIISEIYFGIGDLEAAINGGGGEVDPPVEELRELTTEEKAMVLAAFGQDYSNMSVFDGMYGFEVIRISDEEMQMFDYNEYVEALIYMEGLELFIQYYDYDEDIDVIVQIDMEHALYELYMYTFDFTLFNIDLMLTDGVYFYTDEVFEDFCLAITQDGYVDEIYAFAFAFSNGYVDYVAMEYFDNEYNEVTLWELEVYDVGVTVAYDLEY